MIELKPLVERIVDSGFPELKQVRICAFYVPYPIRKAFLCFGRNNRNKYAIKVCPSLKNVSEGVLTGGLAHELAHILGEVSLDDSSSKSYFRLCRTYSWYQTLHERSTDLTVVKRGFAKQLLEFVIYVEQRREPYQKKDCLTQRELRAIIRGLE
ncbi:MAG: hypothetical protein PHF67_00975 [Candidatus Nanoarchaeia archaeon]|nr:hypothetical protein [Candidatus Nanoarchaeia archaeon]